MAKLHSLAKLMRSKNAGPFSLTYDIMFENVHSYRHAIENNVLGTEISSRHLGVEPQLIRISHYNLAMATKIAVPRRVGVRDPEMPDAPGRTKQALIKADELLISIMDPI